MASAKRSLPIKHLALLGAAELLLLGALGLGTSHEMDRMNQAVDDLSELSDPSPFRAALMGHLGKIHLGLEGYLQSADPDLIEQVVQSRSDFEASIPEFKKQSPRLFPNTATEEIGRTFGTLQEAIDHLLQADARRREHRGKLDQNFTQILSGIDRDIRPLIRGAQPDSEERKEAVLQVENQARAWQQNILRAWTQPTPGAKELTYENDNRGQTHLDRYSRLELLPREKKIQRRLRSLWDTNSDLARESFAMEKVVSEAKAFTDAQRAQVVAALNKYLPALPPAEMEARKQGYARAIRFHLAAAFVIGLLVLVSVAAAILAAFKLKRGESLWPKKPYKSALPADPAEPTLQMDLKGTIAAWSPAAEALYGYSASEMRGKSISILFESESDIERLYKDLQKSPQTIFESTHKAKSGLFFRVRIEFQPLEDAAGLPKGIGLLCTRK